MTSYLENNLKLDDSKLLGKIGLIFGLIKHMNLVKLVYYTDR